MRSLPINQHQSFFESNQIQLMSQHPLKKKSSLVMFGLLVAGATASNLRNTATGEYCDPYCKTWSNDGLCCLKCAHHYFINAHGRC